MDTSTLGFRTREEPTMAGHHPPYPAEFRQQIIELVRTDRTPAELARGFQPTATTIRKW